MNALHHIVTPSGLSAPVQFTENCETPYDYDIYKYLINLLKQTSVYFRELKVKINGIFKLHGDLGKF